MSKSVDNREEDVCPQEAVAEYSLNPSVMPVFSERARRLWLEGRDRVEAGRDPKP